MREELARLPAAARAHEMAATHPRRAWRVPRRALRLLAAAVVTLLFTVPLLWMVVGSLRPAGLPLPTRIEWWPAQPTLAGYRRIFEVLPLARYGLNSLLVVALAVPLTLLTSSWAGFAMAQLPARLRQALVTLLLAALMVPLMAVWLTRFLIYKWLGLLDTPAALVAPAIMGSSPFYVLIMYWAFRRVPREQLEAARLDGAGALHVWWSIGLPQVRPALLAVTVLSFERHWSNFVDPLLYINDPRWYTLPVGLQALQQLHQTQWPLLLAGAVVVTLPAVVVFLAAQRVFLQGYEGSDLET